MTDILGPANAANAVTARPGDTRVWAALDSFFRDCTSDTVDDGTDITAAWLNGVTSVLRSVWRANGNMLDGATPVVTENGTDDNGIAKAIQQLIQRNQPAFAIDTSGVAGVITAALVPAAVEYKRGMRVFVMVANKSAGATVMNLNGLGNKAVTRRDGSTLLDGDLVDGGIAEFVYDGTKWQVPAAWGRPKLTRNATLYVNGAIGNDANDGTANDAAHALRTVQAAINLAWSYTASPYTITINIADGVYNEAVANPNYSGPSIIVNGNAATPSNVAINGGNNIAFLLQGPNTATVNNLKVQANASGSGSLMNGFCTQGGATLVTNNTVSGPMQNPVFVANVGSLIRCGSHAFSGSCESFWYATHGGFIALDTGNVYTVTQPITVSVGTAQVANTGTIQAGIPAPTFVNAGYVTGRRYHSVSNGSIDTQGAGESYFPGTIAGDKINGGAYQ